mgnify:CR=1 FL=1
MATIEAVPLHQIEMISSALKNKHGRLYSDVWMIGCQFGLRISDLLSLRFVDFDFEHKIVTLIEQKTQKTKQIRLNDKAMKLIQQRQKDFPRHLHLFQVDSRRQKNQAISRVSVSRAFKAVGDDFGLKINTHSMRKSRGMAMFQAGIPVAKIARVLNHSSEAATMRYLGITQEEVLQTYDDFVL